MIEHIRAYLEHLRKERNYSPHTIAAYEDDLAQFSEFLARHLGDFGDADHDHLALRARLDPKVQG